MPSCSVGVLLGVLSLVMQSLSAVLLVIRTGQELDHPLGVPVRCLASCVVVAPLGAVPVVGGSSDPSVLRSPGVTLEGRAAHGPLHLAVNRSLETLMALLFVFLL